MLVSEIITYLTNQGLVDGASGWTGAKGYLPPDPDQVIAVFETSGLEPELIPIGSTEEEYDEPGFQIRGRGAEWGYEALRTQMAAVYQALHGSVPTSDYVLVHAVQSGPFPLPMDEENRPGMTWNFLAMRRRV